MEFEDGLPDIEDQEAANLEINKLRENQKRNLDSLYQKYVKEMNVGKEESKVEPVQEKNNYDIASSFLGS